ncbi:histone H2A-Bbd type 1 [Lepus europaeus]|uniref:histone H2A-Bbd type 1 n=1 Tax=Lepus europaeus TaxID=9983 RepID=UPI002B4A4940|nr:histone H2A-Bbd type 1 [Lepus europaeus]
MPGRKHNPCPHRRRRRAVSRSMRAELQFPVSHVERLLREGHYAQRLSSAAPVFLAGVLEYLTSNILELASKEAYNSGRVRITGEHVERAVQDHQQLRNLLEKGSYSEVEEMYQLRDKQ